MINNNSLRDAKRNVIVQALEENSYSLKKSARALGISVESMRWNIKKHLGCSCLEYRNKTIKKRMQETNYSALTVSQEMGLSMPVVMRAIGVRIL